jgi:orotidine-5'-phosphate decarboxylase
MKPFAQRFLELAAERSPFCLGIDPTPQLLKTWGLPDTADGVERMCEIVAAAVCDRLAVVKPQIAYFERFGSRGISILESLIRRFHEQDTLVLVDAKRGDIGSTAEAYAEALLGEDSPLGADAITVHAYLGFGSLMPLLRHAQRVGAGVFVVVRSSNPEGEVVQNALTESGLTVADHLAEAITAFNEQDSASLVPGPAGAVVGATLTGDIRDTLNRLGKSLILAPGIGHQGATYEDLRVRFGEHSPRAIPTASRSVLAYGPGIETLQREIEKQREMARLMSLAEG